MSNDQSNHERFNPLVQDLNSDLKSEKVEEGFNSLQKIRPNATETNLKSEFKIQPNNQVKTDESAIPFPPRSGSMVDGNA